MTKLFVVDLDGCITHPFVTPDWPSITRIRAYNQQALTDPTIPRLSICTGRPFPYAEAVAQWLDIHLPIVFESGGGVYFPDRRQLQFSEAFTENRTQVDQVREWVQTLVETRYPKAMIEFSKLTDAGIVCDDTRLIMEVFALAGDLVSREYPDFEVHHTEVSVNIIHKGCNKANGLRQIAAATGIALHEIAYIGDSSGDVSALKIVGKPFAPANGNAGVKAVSSVMEGETSEGVLQAYELLIAANRQ